MLTCKKAKKKKCISVNGTLNNKHNYISRDHILRKNAETSCTKLRTNMYFHSVVIKNLHTRCGCVFVPRGFPPVNITYEV